MIRFPFSRSNQSFPGETRARRCKDQLWEHVQICGEHSRLWSTHARTQRFVGSIPCETEAPVTASSRYFSGILRLLHPPREVPIFLGLPSGSLAEQLQSDRILGCFPNDRDRWDGPGRACVGIDQGLEQWTRDSEFVQTAANAGQGKASRDGGARSGPLGTEPVANGCPGSPIAAAPHNSVSTTSSTRLQPHTPAGLSVALQRATLAQWGRPLLKAVIMTALQGSCHCKRS